MHKYRVMSKVKRSKETEKNNKKILNNIYIFLKHTDDISLQHIYVLYIVIGHLMKLSYYILD